MQPVYVQHENTNQIIAIYQRNLISLEAASAEHRAAIISHLKQGILKLAQNNSQTTIIPCESQIHAIVDPEAESFIASMNKDSMRAVHLAEADNDWVDLGESEVVDENDENEDSPTDIDL